MAKVVMTFEYEPNMANYPTHDDDGNEIKTPTDAVKFDVANMQEGMWGWDEFLENKDVKIEVVE